MLWRSGAVVNGSISIDFSVNQNYNDEHGEADIEIVNLLSARDVNTCM